MQHSPSLSIQQKKPKLLDQVRPVLRTKHYSLRTEESYVNWIKQFIFYHDKKHPLHLVEVEINHFLTHLAVQKKVSASTQNQALCAIVFLYKHVLRKEPGDFGPLIWAKKSKRLPVVFSNEEVSAIFNQLHRTHWIMAMLLYGSGIEIIGDQRPWEPNTKRIPLHKSCCIKMFLYRETFSFS